MPSLYDTRLLALIVLASSITSIVFGTPAELITSGQTVTLQAPIGDYLYQWSAEVDGSAIAQGSSQSFTFTAPVIPEGSEKKTITMQMLIRTAEGGCVNQTTALLDVYSLPACGIAGPSRPSPEEKATYNYSGGSSGDLKYEWSVDGATISGQGASVTVDWSKYSAQEHTLGLKLTRDYSNEVPGATNPTRTAECTYPVALISHPELTVTKQASSSTVEVGDTITYTYNVTNTGDVTISSIRLVDDKLGNIVLATSSLAPGQIIAVTASYTTKGSDLPGPLLNNATARGIDDKNNPVTVEARASVDLALASDPGCLIDGTGTLCQEKREEYMASVAEDGQYSYSYSWKMDGSSIGIGKSIELHGNNYSPGIHALELTVSTTYQGRSLGTKTCSKEVKVIAQPSANFTIKVL
jgi:hypothetical protein